MGFVFLFMMPAYYELCRSTTTQKVPFRHPIVNGLLRIQPRDIALLRDVGDFRFLNTEQVLALHPGGKRNLTRRLAALFEQGYLDRPESQTSAGLRSAHFVYSLGRKGAEVLFPNAEERDNTLRRVREIQRSFPLVAHAIMISQFHVCLTLALKNSDAKIVRWLQGNELKVALRRHGENPALVPDAFFTLKEKGDVLHFFLEADRATMTQERFVNKLKVYWRFNREGRFNDTLGVPNFRTLTITPSEARSENLRHASKDADPRREGSAMFLFAPETRYNVKAPEALLSAVWRTPKNDTPHSILE